MCVFRRLFIFSIFGLSTISFTSAAETVELKPNDAVYVKMGKKVYVEQCASCHGVNLEGQDGWRNTKVDGMRLAPLMINLVTHGIMRMRCSLTSPNTVLKQ